MTIQYTHKLHPGDEFPKLEARLSTGETVNIAEPKRGLDWKMIVVYRGQHCPLCTRYLNQLANFKSALEQTGVDLIAISADSNVQLDSHLDRLQINFPIAYGLELKQMEQLGLYLSEPRSEQETDHIFSEPGLFVVNENNKLHVVDISNNPFVRPELQSLINGLSWIRNPDNNYPIRGMYK
jgi:peroxiredoxin